MQPKVFISYSWDSPEHKVWSKLLADCLIRKGINVLIDHYDCPPGSSFVHFMEEAVTESDKVLIVMTEKYKEKADSRSNGAGYESMVTSAEIYSSGLTTRIIPLLRQGDYDNSVPLYLKGRVGIDFRQDSDFDDRLDDLIRTIYGHSDKPLPGSPPDYISPVKGSNAAAQPISPLPVFQKPDIGQLKFDHALRPPKVRQLVSRLPESLQLIGQNGCGKGRLIDDLEYCGITEHMKLLRVNLADYIKSYSSFLSFLASKAEVDAQKDEDMVEIVRNCARKHQKPVLFVLENVDDMFSGKNQPGEGFGYEFFARLNTLKNENFSTLWLPVSQSVSHRVFGTQSSPLSLPEYELGVLNYEQIGNEINRRQPDLAENIRYYIQDQLETDPNHTYSLLNALLLEIDQNPSLELSDIKKLLIEKRQKLYSHGRK